MWIPYGILAVLTIGIGIIGLSAEEGIHHVFTEYLEHSFGIHSAHVTGEASILPGFLQGLNPVALGSSLVAFATLLHIVGSRFMTDMGGLRKHMKKTYAFMWAAGLGLMGAPFITTGFWSKDAIFAAVYESGNEWALPLFIIAVLTAVITAFYTTRMIGMVFFGKKSKHIEKMEEEGHHIHEASASMWIPYGILAVLTIGIGIIGLSAEEGIHHVFTEYLEHSFGIHSAHVTGEASILPGFLQGLNPVALGSSLVAFATLLHIVGSRFMTDMGGLRKHMKKTYAFMWAAGLGLMDVAVGLVMMILNI
jgi:NADH:ubiquinone oxidoreductase subunit 5 (subunit L)/multisubunit Na+/H+ antiporter MnhA subunit